MSSEKSDALVIRQADFSESSRVVTLFTRDFGKIACLAKGAKRLKSAFDSALDLLAECRMVFLHKSTTALDLLTEAQLIRRFQPLPKSLPHLYAGYYVAELLNALTEEDDPHPQLYAAAVETLAELATAESPFVPVTRFELITLREIGQLPNFDTCMICHSEITLEERGRFWVTQSGLICSQCGRSEYESTEFHAGSLAILRKLVHAEDRLLIRVTLSDVQKKEIRRLVTSAVSHALGRRPKTLSLLNL